MILASELRLGNLVNTTTKATGLTIQQVVTASMIMDLQSNGLKSSFIYDAIPLSDGVFLKCGYKPTVEAGIQHYVVYRHRVWMCGSLFMCETSGIRLKSLHQLQNIYFALTDKELEINL